MAKSGRSAGATGAGNRADATRRALIEGAIESLRHDGFAGASARAIAARAGCNQALVFYHFGSVTDLLLAALDDVSAQRRARYDAAVAAAATPAEVVAAATGIFREDLDAGYVAVLVEMIAGAGTTPGLGAEVARRIAPWQAFAREAIASMVAGSPLAALVPVDEAAHAVVALYLGLELLSHLDDDRAPALALFDRAAALAALLPTAPPPPTAPTKESR